MPTPTLSRTLNDPVVATLDTYIRKTPADVIFNRNLLLRTLWNSAKEPGVAGPEVKGLGVRSPRVVRRNARELWIPVNRSRSTNTTTFRHLDPLSTTIDTGLTVQRAVYAYYTDFAAISWQEAQENSGPEGIIDLMQSRIDRVYASLSEDIETDLWSTNGDTSDTSKGILGLQTLVSTVDTETVWNIDRDDYSWQRNNNDTVASFATNGLDKMRDMYTDTSGTSGVDPASVILTTPDVWQYYVKAAESKHRIVDSKDSVDLSFPAARYMGIPVTYSGSCPSGYMYFLNLNYFYLCMPPGADFSVVRPPMPNNQLIESQWRVVWGGQIGCERFDRQGVLSSITA